jgi:predicted ArsR family transcriptional regulator
MSRSRAALLETLQAQPEPTTLSGLVDATGLHPNTLREHLEEYGADASRARLFPFSEPGACRLELLARPSGEQR